MESKKPSPPVSSEGLAEALKSLDQMLKIHMVSVQGILAGRPIVPPVIPSVIPAVKGRNETKLSRKPSKKTGIELLKDMTKKTFQIRTDQVKVSVRVVFTKIGVIDTIHDRYSAEVMITSKWREPALDNRKVDLETIDWSDYWEPKLSISNSMNDLKYQVVRKVDYDLNGRAIACERRQTGGQFFEFMELNKFPFDSQDLTITVLSERETSELLLVEDEFEASEVNFSAFSSSQEWAIADKVNVWTKTTTKKTETAIYNYPNFCVAAKVTRRPQFFIWNIIVILFTICSLAFSTFTVKMETPESRLPLTFILVLTTVTFKFVVNKNLPRISYLTLMDKYILGCMVILVTICVWHSIAGAIVYNISSTTTTATTTTPAATIPSMSILPTILSDVVSTTMQSTTAKCPQYVPRTATSMGKTIDRIVLGVMAAIYIMFHVVFALIIFCKSKHDEGPNEELFDKDDGVTSSHEGETSHEGDTTALNVGHSTGNSKASGRGGVNKNDSHAVAAQLAIGGD